MWGGSVCCNTLGPPVKLWTTGRVGRQFVLSVYCVKFMPVTSSVSCQCHRHSEQKCLSLPISACQSHSNTRSVMPRSVMFSPYSNTDINQSIMFAPDSHTTKCSSTQFGPQHTQHLPTLFVIQASAVPGLSHIIAERERTDMFS